MVLRNLTLPGKHKRQISLNVYHPGTKTPPTILFVHGFKGFKDWGHWDLIGRAFNTQGFAFVAINTSYNGVVAEKPTEFTDLQAFGNNNYTIELDDIGSAIDFISSRLDLFNPKQIYLIGHSRGGGLGIVKAAEDSRVKGLVTWASVGSLDFLFTEENIQAMEKDGVAYTLNSRTGQKLPLYRQFYQNYKANEERFDLGRAIKQGQAPTLLIHGDEDAAVNFTAALELEQISGGRAKVHIIKGADHVFGGYHPYTASELSPYALELVQASAAFLGKIAQPQTGKK